MPPGHVTPLDARVAARAARQEGLVRRSDLPELGVHRAALRHRVDHGLWHPLHPGVWAVGHDGVSRRAEYLAAVWWAGPGSALSHASAAAFRGWVVEDEDHPPPVHVTTTGGRRTRRGVLVHRTRHLPRRDVLPWGALWVTDDARTLFDLADDLTDDELRVVADRLPELPRRQLEELAERLPGRRGAGRVQRLLGSEGAHTRSAMERRWVAYSDHHGLPHPDGRNVLVHGFRVDCWYRDARLVLELDSRAHHTRRAEMEADRHRDRGLARAGIATLRLVWHDLDPADDLAARDLRQRLAG